MAREEFAFRGAMAKGVLARAAASLEPTRTDDGRHGVSSCYVGGPDEHPPEPPDKTRDLQPGAVEGVLEMERPGKHEPYRRVREPAAAEPHW